VHLSAIRIRRAPAKATVPGIQGRLHDQCVFETTIATQLRTADRAERAKLYRELYDSYAEAFPEALPTGAKHRTIMYELAFARRFVGPKTIVMELGPGRCEFAAELAKYADTIVGVDVSELAAQGSVAANFEFVLTDGIHIPRPDESIDVVISNQLMEHLHPDDAVDQLEEICRVLRPGGRYICMTPNRLSGPHDFSAYFDDLPCPVVDRAYQATGLHLKEYINEELIELFRRGGLIPEAIFIGARGHYTAVPANLMRLIESTMRLLPVTMRKRSKICAALLGVRIVGRKPPPVLQ
jgi:SAM-dependent methyltransferase